MIHEAAGGTEGRTLVPATGRRWAGARTPLLAAAAVTVASVAARLAPMPRLVDGESGTALGGVSLHTPAAYVMAAPLTGLLDTLSLLTVRQHVALGVTVLAAIAVWRAGVAWHGSGHGSRYGSRADGPARPSRGRRAVQHVAAATGALAAVVAFYAAGALLPRPMARLATTDPAAVLVDFHSHTAASHDGRRGFTVDASRAWHAAAGFDAFYVTDHGRLDRAVAAYRGDPARAADGIVVLPGIEVVYQGEHVVGLGPGALAALGTAPTPPGVRDTGTAWPVVVHTIPERLLHIAPPGVDGRGGATAIELVDGAPRGLGQAARDRERILRIADSLDLAVVAGSNNHGWGRTAVAWSVLRIPGWRALGPDALDRAIQHAIRTRRRHAVRVVRRHPVPGARSPVGLALVAPALLWTTLATQSAAECLVTMGWAWAAALGVMLWRARHDRQTPSRSRPATSSPVAADGARQPPGTGTVSEAA